MSRFAEPSAPVSATPEPPRPEPRTPLARRFFRLTGFNILANLTVPLAGLVDTAMLGHLDEIRFLAGVALASILFDTIYWTLGFLRMGTTGTTAQAVGAASVGTQERDEIYRVLYRSLTLAASIGLALLVLQVPIRELGFQLLGGEVPVEAAGRDYFTARIWAAPAVLANFALLGWFLGREESGRALAITAVGNLGNIALNYVFIIRLGMAARGAGLATALSQGLMLATALALLAACRPLAAWRWREVLERRRLRALLALNGDILIRSLLLSATFATFTGVSSILGTVTLTANTVLMRLFLVASYLIDGVAYATESLSGVLHGRRDRATFRRMERLALASGGAIAVVLLAVFFTAPRGVLGLLTSHREVIEEAVRLGVWLIPVLLFGAAAFVYDGIFLGLTEGRILRNRMLFSALVVFAPLALVAYRLASAPLLWAALTGFMASRAVTLALAEPAARRTAG